MSYSALDVTYTRSCMLSAAVSLAAAVAVAAAPAQAATIFDESIAGDLSNSGLAPTNLSFGLGSNQVFGTTGRSVAGGPIDFDYFTFTVLPGAVLSSIQVLPGTTSIGPATVSFIGLQAGSQVTVDPTMASAAPLLGYSHYGPADVGSDILPRIGTGAGAQGFTAPLGAGSYAVWLQEANVGSANYGFDFQLTAVPEPATWAMMLAGFGAIGLALRFRRRSRVTVLASSRRALA